jgi:mRNA interferase RelE/StbE
LKEASTGWNRNPHQQGKSLRKELAGKRSKKVAGGRYRIVYETDLENHMVYIKGVGIRKEGSKDDVYERMKKRL